MKFKTTKKREFLVFLQKKIPEYPHLFPFLFVHSHAISLGIRWLLWLTLCSSFFARFIFRICSLFLTFVFLRKFFFENNKQQCSVISTKATNLNERQYYSNVVTHASYKNYADDDINHELTVNSRNIFVLIFNFNCSDKFDSASIPIVTVKNGMKLFALSSVLK